MAVSSENNGWENFGDVSFTEYGGTLVRPSHDADYQNDYEYFKLMVDEYGYKYAFSGTIVDLGDYVEEDCVKELAEELNISPKELFNTYPMNMVATLLDDYGCGVFEFSPHNKDGQGQYSMDLNDFRVNDRELACFMKDLDIPEKYQPVPIILENEQKKNVDIDVER